MSDLKFYFCKHCGKIVFLLKDSGVPTVCCGDEMQELKAGVTDAAMEKHVPAVKIEANKVSVTVGSVEHPMEEKHYIEWILLETNQGIYQKRLAPGKAPKADFLLLDGEQAKAVYEYCNLHKLWKADV